jgi:cytochrome o ubiquinol oxidase subunit IV
MSRTLSEHTAGHRITMGSYVTGFILSIILTTIPFALVAMGSWSPKLVLTSIFIAGIIQILVHLHYFLHFRSSRDAEWNLMALIFTILIMILFVGGGIWVMQSLHHRMM